MGLFALTEIVTFHVVTASEDLTRNSICSSGRGTGWGGESCPCRLLSSRAAPNPQFLSTLFSLQVKQTASTGG